MGRYLKYLYYSIFHIDVIHILGDSHGDIFIHFRENDIFNNTVFKVFTVTGATAIGINKLNSKTKSRLYFNSYLRSVRKNHVILISLGEVDCDYVLWMKKKKENTDIDRQLYLALKRYMHFVNDIYDQGYKNIIIYSAPLPTIKKSEKGGWVSKHRRDADISIEKRTKLTRLFNREMKHYCLKKGINFLDIENEIINSKTGLVSDKYVNPNRLDHHLYKETTIPLITKLLKSIGYN